VTKIKDAFNLTSTLTLTTVGKEYKRKSSTWCQAKGSTTRDPCEGGGARKKGQRARAGRLPRPSGGLRDSGKIEESSTI